MQVREGEIKKHILLFISLVISFSSTISYATEATYEQHIARGIYSLETTDYKDAVGEFTAALKDRPGDFRATLYLGITLSRSGDGEAEATLKKALSMKPEDPRANLELGIYYFNVSAYDVATGYLERARKVAPNTEYSAKAEEYVMRIRAGGPSKPWFLSIGLGVQYDSNVVLNGEDNPLPQGISRKSDWRAVASLKGRYDLLKTEKAEGSVGYSLYQSLHTKLSDFNTSQHVLDLKASRAISPSVRLTGMYSFEYTFVDGDGYVYVHTLSPAFVISEGKGFSTSVEYRYSNNHYRNSDLFPDNADRTGSNNLIGLTQTIPLHPSVLGKVGFSHDLDSTRKDFWDYRGDKGFGALQFSLRRNIYLDVYGEYYHKDYKGLQPATGGKRKDKVYTASISATKRFSERYSVTLGELYIRNKSNTAVFDYKRAITSLFLNVRF